MSMAFCPDCKQTVPFCHTCTPPVKPIPMILHCPICFHQHIDRDETIAWPPLARGPNVDWTTTPHRSHKCANCGAIWRPADVPTTGVASINTHGKNDTVVYDK